ncbi:alpha/beta fold hydrolase [Polymorphospora sp. NPDC051019]|uniref:alpha/beta fold hydrolase n=1 Tax=Polymorphospora sp. NPDC051019 TaxID=3155725 RepID=UPI003438F499
MTGGEASRVSTGDGVTSFRVEGAGPPLVLVHGLQVGQELFAELRPHLVSAFTVITYDQRDRGETVFAPVPYTTDDLADDLAALITALGFSRAHVLGTSFGGMVAQVFALRHPHLLDALVLGATSQAPFRPERLAGPVAGLLGALEAGDGEKARALLARMAPTVASATGDGGLQSEPARNDALMRRFTATRAFDTRGRLAAIVARTLVVHGRDDAMVPIQDALSMAGEIAHADVLVLAGAGHAWENDQPARAASAIAAFLADTG